MTKSSSTDIDPVILLTMQAWRNELVQIMANCQGMSFTQYVEEKIRTLQAVIKRLTGPAPSSSQETEAEKKRLSSHKFELKKEIERLEIYKAFYLYQRKKLEDELTVAVRIISEREKEKRILFIMNDESQINKKQKASLEKFILENQGIKEK